MTDFEQKMVELEERKVVAEEKKAEALELLAENILQGFREHASVNKRDVAYALENVAAAISRLDFRKENEKDE